MKYKIAKFKSFVTKDDNKKPVITIEGFANRAFKDGKKVIDRAKEHIPAKEWKIEDYDGQLLFNHDRNCPVGGITEVKVVDDGLWIKGTISNSDVEEIRKVRDLVEEGYLKTFSVGIDVEEEEQGEDGTINLKGVKLIENSIVTIPMNAESKFTVSKKMLKTKSLESIKVEICKTKGANVAAEVHQQIAKLQEADKEFSRADILGKIAASAKIPQDTLIEILAGNTVEISEEILASFAENLQMDLEALKQMNDIDMSLNNLDKVLNPQSEDDSSEPKQADQLDAGKVSDETKLPKVSDVQAVANANPKDSEELLEEDETKKGDVTKPEDEELLIEDETKKEEKKPEIELLQNAINAMQEGKDSKEILAKLHESLMAMVEGKKQENPEPEVVVEVPASDEEFHKCMSDKIEEGLKSGKSQPQAIAYALSTCQKKDKSKTLSKEDWKKIFGKIENKKNTTEIQNVQPQDVNLGSPAVAAAQQTNVLLGNLIGEIQGLKQILQSLLKPTMPTMPTNGMQLSYDLKPDENENLDIINKYRENLDDRLKKLGY